MASIRDQLPPPPPPPPERRGAGGLLGEDYRFTPNRLPVLSGFRLEHESVHLLERPLALERVYRLRDPGDLNLSIGFRLCVAGRADAIESLYRFVEGFQRPIPAERVHRTSDEGLGEFGLAWTWDDPLGDEMVAFVRANVLVTVAAPDGAGLATRVARAIDGELAPLRTTDAYAEAIGGVLAAARQEAGGGPTRVPPGGRVTLGRQPAVERWFFLTSAGAANRDPATPDLWYYRAGLATGPAELRLFRTDDGLIPVVERLALDVG